MKKSFVALAGALCLCLLSQSGFAADTDDIGQLTEKGSRSRSKSKVKIYIPNNHPHHPPIACPEGPQGPTGATGATGTCCDDSTGCGATGAPGATGATGAGPTGPRGPTGPVGSPQTFVTVSVGATGSTGALAPITAPTFEIPFDTTGPYSLDFPGDPLAGTAVNIPVGVYNVHFQTILFVDSSVSVNTDQIFLKVSGTAASEADLPLDWVLTEESSDSESLLSYTGETILEVRDPGGDAATVGVELVFDTDNSTTLFVFDPKSEYNSPARLVLTKVGELPPAP